ncbi:MAG: hypothetical protein NUW37_02730 [Planctomycetes bacterium]|nr:hypothetical protein [Planctomycetota bacterium]
MNELRAVDFNLAQSIESGQWFRYEKTEEGEYFVTVADKVIRCSQKDDVLRYDGADEAFVVNFFALDEDYNRIVKMLSIDKKLKNAVTLYRGLRILRQPRFECLLNFICSSNSNIKRIKMTLDTLAANYGRSKKAYGRTFNLFPTPKELAKSTADEIASLGAGYRSPWIPAAAQKYDEAEYAKMTSRGYKAAREYLLTFDGVGPKVADCVALFSLGYPESFPVDVWVLRTMRETFPEEEFKNEKVITAFAWERWGDLAGYAQQFLFHERRLRDKVAKSSGV